MPYTEITQRQADVIQIITNSYQNNKLVHAYIFGGDKGTGKWPAALYFASLLMCESDLKPCGNCHSCKRVLNGQHVNVYVIEPFNNIIRKDQIEGLIQELSSTSLEDGNRVYIIKDAEKMNLSASNALLKFLEEPYPHHYIVLLSSNPQLLLDTIKSRSQFIHFKPVSPKLILEELINKGVNKDIAYVLANMTSSIDMAEHLINGGWVTDVLELVKAIQKAKNKKQDIYVVFFKKSKFLFNEAPLNIHQLFFDVMLLLVREKIKYLYKANHTFFNDVIGGVDWELETNETLLYQLEILSEYQERINYHVNLDLLYMSLFLEL